MGNINKEIPDFTNCVRDKNGELWCWDNINKTVCRVIPVDRAVPQEVLYDLLKAVNKDNQ